MSIPDVRVEVAFETTPDDPSPVWEDVTSYVDLSAGISITRGRQDEFSQVQPSTCSLTLDNSDGRFTAGLSSSPYYPNVKIGRKVRIFTGPDATQGYNLIDGDTVSFDGGTVGDWTASGSAVLASSAARAHDGSRSMRITFPTTVATAARANLSIFGAFANGQDYTISVWVYVPTGSPRLTLLGGGGSPSTSTLHDQWERLAVTFTSAVGPPGGYSFGVRNEDASTSGQVAYVDSLMLNAGTSPEPFVDHVARPRFTGYVDEWPLDFAPAGKYAQATVTASDRLKRFGQIAAFTNVVGEEILSDSPTTYYPLGEDDGATSAGDLSGLGSGSAAVTQVGSGGSITFAANTGPGTDGLSAPSFAPASSSQGKYLNATLNTAGLAGTTVRAAFLTSVAATQTIAKAFLGSSYVELRTTSAGKLQGAVFDGITEATFTSSSSVNNGLTHDAMVTLDAVSGSVALYLDGTSVASGSATGLGGALSGLRIGGDSVGNLFTGTISHVATYNTALAAARASDHWHAVNDGFIGDSSDERIARYARWAGISSADQNLEAGDSTSIAHVDTTGVAPLQAMQDIAATESGVLFIAGDGRLTFHARSHRYGASTAATLDEIGEGDTFVVNDQQLVNDVTASRSGGITYRAVATDSVTDYGSYRQDIQLLTTSDNEVVDAANWIANSKSMPQPRLPQLTIDLLTNTSIQSAALALEIGSLVSLSGLPTQAPDAASDFFIEGWTESISTQDWSLVCNTSPAGQTSVWVLDDSVFSVLGQTTTLAY